MFEVKDSRFKDFCFHCKWEHTSACPHSMDFIGETMFSTNNKKEACHRFVLTDEAREFRWQQTAQKLSQGIDFDD